MPFAGNGFTAAVGGGHGRCRTPSVQSPTVKVLHTSDWHVGRTLRGRNRADEHREVLAEVAAIARDEEADLVLVCGDLFDTAAPTPESERIVYGALLELAATGATVVVIAGNHDSARRLQAVEPLLQLGKVVTRPFFVPPADGGVVEVVARDGVERAKLAVLPFLSQRHVVRADALMAFDAADHAQSYDSRVRRLVDVLCSGFDGTTVNLVAAHLTAKGGLLGGGERAAHTVFDYEVGTLAFPASAQYVALGHLHRMQEVPGPCPIRYCGSPLQLDFGETNDRKGVLLVEARPGTPATVRPVELAAGRRLRILRGTLAELAAVAGTTDSDWLKVIVREAPRVGLADEVRTLFPEAVVVAVERPEPAGAVGAGAGELSRRGRTPAELFAAYLDDRGIEDPPLQGLFAEILEQVSS
jgi:exonuclease SbcD